MPHTNTKHQFTFPFKIPTGHLPRSYLRTYCQNGKILYRVKNHYNNDNSRSENINDDKNNYAYLLSEKPHPYLDKSSESIWNKITHQISENKTNSTINRQIREKQIREKYI